MSYPLLRRHTSVIVQKLTDQILQANGNENDPGAGGGTCFGDSGGPIFYDRVIVGVTSYGYTSNCRYIDGYQRVDIKDVQTWLARFGVTRPADPFDKESPFVRQCVTRGDSFRLDVESLGRGSVVP
ncbi:MAG: trypsin-like serine protease [Nocardioidaceae bacterium]